MDAERDDPKAVWRYERALDLPIAPKRAFALFTDPVETHAWLLPFEENAEGVQQTTIEGQPPVTLEVIRHEPPKLIHTRMSGGNMPGHADMIVEVSEDGRGARVDIRHLGFGDGRAWEVFGSSFRAGWAEAYADLLLYLRTGVKLPRHIEDARASIAAWPVRRDYGLEIAEVFPGGFADQAGMRAGDILIKLDRAGVYEVTDVWTFTRTRSAGEGVEATYIRGGALLTGRGRLNRFEDFGE